LLQEVIILTSSALNQQASELLLLPVTLAAGTAGARHRWRPSPLLQSQWWLNFGLRDAISHLQPRQATIQRSGEGQLALEDNCM
jgi:hypothetical protein